MKDVVKHDEQLADNGFTIIENVYSDNEVKDLIDKINASNTSNPTFRRSEDLFAIRQFLKEIPKVNTLVFTDKLKSIITQLFGSGYFVVKSIYFDKPEQSNWFVAYHQDLTISVDRKSDLDGFNSWTKKHNQFAVQPPTEILENNFTIRIHLDNTDANNGALKVIQGSHLKGVYRPENIDWASEKEISCNVNQGGVMIMRPLLLHASERTTNNERRRVIHVEFSKTELPDEIKWSERDKIS